MAKLSIVAGATSQSVNIFVQNSSVTTGAGLTGFAPAGGSLLSGMVFYYSFSGTNAASVVQSLSVPATVGAAFSAGSIVEIDATNMPGVARLDLPNAMLASAKGRSVVGIIKGGTNVAPVVLEIELTAVDNQSTGFGLVNASANVVQISGSAVSTTSAQIGVNVVNINAQTATAAAGVTFPSSIASPTNITAGTITTVTNLTNAPTAGDFTATMKTSLNSSTPTSVTTVTGNVNGSVNSVTSAVTVSGTSTLTESYAAQGAGLTLAQALYGINQFLGQHSTSGTTWTIKKRDGSTTAKTYTLDSATAPTSISEST